MGKTGCEKSNVCKPTFPLVAHLCLVHRPFHTKHKLVEKLFDFSYQECMCRNDNNVNIILFDTPGFDDTTKADLEVLGKRLVVGISMTNTKTSN